MGDGFGARVLLPTLAVVGSVALVIAALLTLSAAEADRVAAARERRLAVLVLRQQFEQVARDQQGSTIWDDAVRQVRARPLDARWLDLNLGVWFREFYGHDRAYILDPRDQPIYAMVDGRRAEPEAFGAVAGAALPLAGELRRAEAPLSEDAADPTPTTAELALVDGRPALLSLKPIVSDTGDIEQAPGSEYFHLSVRYLDGGFLRAVAERYQFGGARFRPAGARAAEGEARLAFRARDGRLVGWFAWRPFRPGLAVARQVAPVLGAALLLVALVVAALLTRVRRAAAALRASEREAQRLAFHDALTGLPNRAAFDQRLAGAFAALARDEGGIALFYLDLDRFKQVNDTLGHPAGDALIVEFGRRLAACAGDGVARLGGDEFAIVRTGAGARDGAEDLCGRIIAAMREPANLFGARVTAGASIGVAFAPGDAADPVELKRRADIALYRAKDGGRGRWACFAEEMDDGVRLRAVEDAQPIAPAARCAAA